MTTKTQTVAEELQIVETAKNYVKAFKDRNPDLVKQYFQPTAFKMGYFYDFDKKEWMDIAHHPYEQIIEWTKHYNAEGIMPNSELKAHLLDMKDKTAVVSIVAEWAPGRWGHDYILLSKIGEQWLISTIFWQDYLIK